MRRLAYLLIMLCAVPSFSQSYPDVEALLDAFFAKDAKALVQYMPVSLQNALEQLSANDQLEFEQTFLLAERGKREGLIFIRSDAPPVLVEIHKEKGSEEGKESVAEVELDKRICDGYESLLRLKVRDKGRGEFPSDASVMVWMRLEEGQWRVLEAQPLEGSDLLSFDDPKLIAKFHNRHMGGNEAVAVGSIRIYNTAFITYAAAYPNIGFPSDLQSLGAGADPSATSSVHAGLVDNSLSNTPFEKNGYRFTYRPQSASGPTQSYTVIARPTAYGTTGKRSFFSDESGVIRFTDEDREPTAADDPLQ